MNDRLIIDVGLCSQVRRYKRLKVTRGPICANAYAAKKMRDGTASQQLVAMAADLVDPKRTPGRPAGGIAIFRAIRVGRALERARTKKASPVHEAEADLAAKLGMDVRNVQMADKLYKDGMRNFHEGIERAYRGFGRRQRK